ncbi:autotransporter outer membrane beta-barrel domain-containing protein [Pseudomonas sp. 1912-s]|uniref:autotransporter domain-containing protein n=1 Tax=Pseudomonas sp. 1912-s TaxID=3033802 RepID=UPI0023E01867|nr:autotransporter domain-containing protein [Pseudomonas sp. 1912-s]MDF3202849.1 autotransporter outer membrane beta-barrel domain-containing protein [Pseudomonas sp. 1912-s]
MSKPKLFRKRRSSKRETVLTAITVLFMSAEMLTSTYLRAQELLPPYVEKGMLGDRNSWKSPEFKANWGLASDNFDAAYAAGATGQGVRIGILDSGTYAQHFDFSTLHNVKKFPIPFLDGDVPDYKKTEGGIDDHGTHVAGIMVANRNGVGMHGGAFNSTLYIGRAFHDELSDSTAADAIVSTGLTALSNSWGRDFDKNKYRHLMRINVNGKKQWAGYGPNIDDVTDNNKDQKILLSDPASELSQLAKLASSGTIVIFAAGNDRYYSASYEYDLNNLRPRMFRGVHSTFGTNMLPTLLVDDAKKFRSVEKNFLNVVMLNNDHTISHYSDICGTSKYYCVGAAGGTLEGPLNSYPVTAPKVPDGVNVTTYVPGPEDQYIKTNVQNTDVPSDYYRIFSTGVQTTLPGADGDTQQKNLTPNYAMMFGTSMAAPTAAAGTAVIKSRFPYLTNSQVRDTLLSTATDEGAPGIDRVYGWGSMDLAEAMGGPAKFWALKASYDSTLTEIEQRAADQYNPIVAKADYYGNLAYVTYNQAKNLRDSGDLAGATSKEAIAKRYADKAFALELTRLHPNEAADTQDAAFEYYDFQVSLPGVRSSACDSDKCIADTWSNNIDGPGGLSKLGDGHLTLTGASIYKGPTSINGGLLTVNGSVTSPVTISSGGTLGGSGSVGSITANSGAMVAPGNSIGTLHVTHDVSFAKGSVYAVEVGNNNTSDQIQAGGKATINGGALRVSLEHSPTLLSKQEVLSLMGEHYNILNAIGGITGQFETVSPGEYPFLGMTAKYATHTLSLDVGRNARSFVSVAQTANERALATAADTLKAGNPVYESVLLSGTEDQARRAFSQLDGQTHADIAATLIDDTRYLREAINSRLQQTQTVATSANITSSGNGGWVQLLGGHNSLSADDNATGYSASNSGVLLGMDTDIADGWLLGAAAGYTQTKLDGSGASKANSDNYHLSLYGGKSLGNIALRAGTASTWSRLDTSRRIDYNGLSDYQKSAYTARTDQVFAETGYTGWARLEPFANLAYINFQSENFKEHGGSTSLHGKKQSQDATLSTLGVRANAQLPVTITTPMTVSAELGWQHQYGELDRQASLTFQNSEASFDVKGVPVSRDGAVIKVGAKIALTKDTLFSLNYSGLHSGNNQSNAVNLGFTFSF